MKLVEQKAHEGEKEPVRRMVTNADANRVGCWVFLEWKACNSEKS